MSSNAGQRTFTFHHDELGDLTGLVTPENVVQFRAIPYATIPGRFKRSILQDKITNIDRLFTENGYACPQIFPDENSSGGTFPGEIHPPPSDEFKCLILQLNVPLVHLQSQSHSSSKLPVLVYIHGGGFVLGKIDPQHNTALLVEQSILDSQPIISASIQYRLGALGYLHTPEPETANLALNDQRNALYWIQRFVGGFGGDSARVTVFGESAGAISICGHMLAAPPPEGPLFTRVVLMSGIIGPSTAPNSVEKAEEQYEAFLERLGVQTRGEDGMQELRDMDVQRIVETSAEFNDEGSMWLSVLDREWFGEEAKSVTWDRIPELLGKCEWVDEVVLGTTSFEGTPMMSRLATITPQAFVSSITQQLGPRAAELACKAYAITPAMDHNLFTTSAMRWIGDVIFDAPTHLLARHLSTRTSKPTYRYLFDVRNPFAASPLYQQPHHWVDVYFVFKTFQFRYPSQRLKNISTQHARLWVDFANGKAPWARYEYGGGQGDEVVMVADEREGWVEKKVREVEEALEWGWGRCDLLVESWEAGKMKGRGFRPLDIEALRGVKKT